MNGKQAKLLRRFKASKQEKKEWKLLNKDEKSILRKLLPE